MQIRPMNIGDIPGVARLSDQFGYPATEEQVLLRFHRVHRDPRHGTFAAVDAANRIIGWIHVFERLSLGGDPCAEIGGIVVDRDARQRGVGRSLMEHAEMWSKQMGLPKVRLRSGTERPEAHTFYPNLGYERSKTQHVYEKNV